MKSIKYILFCTGIWLFSFASFAGPRVIGNGGDPWELKFREVALNIHQWILSGNADQIKLPESISLKDYKDSMQAALNNYSIEFTTKILRIGGSEKVCVNYRVKSKKQIVCNEERFRNLMTTNPDFLYQLIHHEFAGLCGFENNKGSDSSYFISEQLSEFLKREVVKRLPISPPQPKKFTCSAEIDSEMDSYKIDLKPGKEGNGFLSGVLSNIFIETTLWEGREGFDLNIYEADRLFDPSNPQIATDGAGKLKRIFEANPSFGLSDAGSNSAIVFYTHTVNQQAYSPAGLKIPLRITCSY